MEIFAIDASAVQTFAYQVLGFVGVLSAFIAVVITTVGKK